MGIDILTDKDNNYKKRFWECDCCGSLLVTNIQDDATKYQCPQCHISKCDDGGKYVEITLGQFCKEANIVHI